MLVLNGRKVLRNTIEVENVFDFDYPDFCDAYISFAEFEDGQQLTEKEISQLEKENDTLVNELAHESHF